MVPCLLKNKNYLSAFSAQVILKNADKYIKNRDTLNKGEKEMIVLAHFAAVDHGILSLYEVAAHGTLAYGVYANGEWMTFDNAADAKEYASMV